LEKKHSKIAKQEEQNTIRSESLKVKVEEMWSKVIPPKKRKRKKKQQV